MGAGNRFINLISWAFLVFTVLFTFITAWRVDAEAGALNEPIPQSPAVPMIIPLPYLANVLVPVLDDDMDIPDGLRISHICSELLGFRMISGEDSPEEYHFSALTPVMRRLTDRGGMRTINKAVVTKSSSTGLIIAVYAQKRATGSGHQCFAYVADALVKAGINLKGESAYMAAHQLALCPGVREVRIAKKEQLNSLPRGAIAVWDRNFDHRDGHISISLGNGREVSDVLRDQITDYGTSYRVFVPSDMVAMVTQATPRQSGFESCAAHEGNPGRIYAELR